MSTIYLMIPLALVLVAAAVWALVWAIRSGQFDDLESQGWSVVLDDDRKPPATDDAAADANPDDDINAGSVKSSDKPRGGGQA
ncbi:cbb3-type cytochrome oxidase assembly protein CcoS [Marinihelvus fidelis]|uniref:Cbb3-type cytochrome oxidase assembly protein CcoS n=1 Tax=Marinihelvus fidelis TaxID=2613842 RepID=A0A5N0TCU1_9GAMM|nr:cbb3-type cytochrome oxidase assembly protein CcoS [Marinihelvus fidelis]KAA9132571.1 cbb3-type cytochrome oxidase assembly protein CcoS [Marinihelvus fidelis]